VNRREGAGDVLDDWYGRNPHRSAPEVDFGMSWRTTSEPNQRWRVSWNSGSRELFAARLDRREVQVLGMYPGVSAVLSALGEWAPRALEAGGLDWVRFETRDFGVGTRNNASDTVLDPASREWLRIRLADTTVDRTPNRGVDIERP
jgi:hypothetical protein